ncbi:MAG: zf-HC2 domain-containing protein, partial [Elusimicrobiota bacterium]|nr:zf-HC2 domain-containing protein [Elusimicrobiota bacterium]
MNICDKLPLYLYNEMSGEEMLEFREHLLHCRECSCNARLFAKLKNIKTLQSAPPGIIESVLNKTARRGKNSKRRKLVKTAFAAISAAVLAAFLTASETPNSNSAANNK